jgi:pyridoxal phosphate enzyme (YggS family)
MNLQQRYTEVMQRIEAAAAAAQRPPSAVRLVAVTKAAPVSAITELVRLGHLDLGESRVQQLVPRAAEVAATAGAEVRWHMIGHLQRNKVRELLPVAGFIHSVDSLRLAQAISAEAQRTARTASVLLQVNASLEPQKYGAPLSDAPALAEQMAALPGLQLAGLMTMAELSDDTGAVRAAFARTRELFQKLAPRLPREHFRELSMGMSHDFELAIAEGATLVRVGSALFADTEVQA